MNPPDIGMPVRRFHVGERHETEAMLIGETVGSSSPLSSYRCTGNETRHEECARGMRDLKQILLELKSEFEIVKNNQTRILGPRPQRSPRVPHPVPAAQERPTDPRFLVTPVHASLPAAASPARDDVVYVDVDWRRGIPNRVSAVYQDDNKPEVS
eukprot:GHVH01003686.1.p1 GENE.GHVH01003686.1~~GHVH01003686.1.p1  ORF type:complete len:155 (+),score=16.37 GHVH01003686.1:168-632(+)